MPETQIKGIDIINSKKPINSRLTAIRFGEYYIKPNGKRHRLIVCSCECGKEVAKRTDHVISGRSLSCGCFRDARTKEANTKYFPVIEDIYNSWWGMIRRCTDPFYTHYKYYGGRGVTVCKEWLENYQNFLDWSLANGWAEGLEIDKDIKGNGLLYSPETCMWATKAENNHTKSNSIRNFGAFKDGKLVHSFFDIKEAIEIIGGKPCSYTQVLKGQKKTLFGYELKFLKDGDCK